MSLTDAQLRETHDVYLETGSVRATAHKLGIGRHTTRQRLDQALSRLGLQWGLPTVGGEINGTPLETRLLPVAGRVAHYIITSAQNNTHAHMPFLRNLEAYAKHLGAEILVSQYTYNKSSYGKKAVKPGHHPTFDDLSELWFDEALDPYVCNTRIELAPSLVFCGEVQIIPTATRPLSGFETYTDRKSGIFPHSKLALESVGAVGIGAGAKFNYTTGTVTARNYIKRKAGLKAEHHHSYAALHVEVNSDGNWWVRQLSATDNGAFFDLDIYVCDGRVSPGHAVEAINYGDLHVDCMDPDVRRVTFGPDGILDTLRPSVQFCHDVLDFRSRNHHEMKDPHAMFTKWAQAAESVSDEIRRVKMFLENEAARPWCKTVVVDSNHDNALTRWLREADWKLDPVNAIFWLETQLSLLRAIKCADANFHLLEKVLQDMGLSRNVKFLRDDESYVIAGEIECGMHGHLGVDGARGSPLGLSRMGRKANTGHTHKAQILDGVYVAGTSSLLRLNYNKGPSSWSHSHVVTYSNGKRAILTIWEGGWRA